MILMIFFNKDIMLRNDLKLINIFNDLKFFINLSLITIIRA